MLKIYAPDDAGDLLLETPRFRYITRVTPDPGWKYEPHSHDDLYEITFVLSGRGHYEIEGLKSEACAGDAVIFDKGAVHSECSDISDPLDAWGIGFKGLRLAESETGHLVTPGSCPVIPLGQSAQIAGSCFEAIYDACARPGAYSSMRCNHAVSMLLSLLAETGGTKAENSPAPKKDTLAQRVLDYIDHNYAQPLTLKSIAEKFFISPDRLGHVVKEETGKSTIDYLIGRRIGESQKHLLSTMLPVNRIANMVGYPSASHFSNVFTKKLGITPIKFRKKYNIASVLDEK